MLHLAFVSLYCVLVYTQSSININSLLADIPTVLTGICLAAHTLQCFFATEPKITHILGLFYILADKLSTYVAELWTQSVAKDLKQC